ncbi:MULTISPECIES: ABC1 kinase family protein [unclassified Sphingomonas]|uniref:ABC1 kinase family protein n=1 Tax=unclassified Sphingomonas TaxID=196159 RepID=UPI000835975B|nr:MULTISPECIES: AarF/ABC1/UbiB kinase family protein [unclassified Sphingomonas]
MALPPDRRHGTAVPTGRFARLARFGGLASGVAGGMLVDGARQFAAGKRPNVGDLLLTPANAMRVTAQLAQLRGAAMKMGQLLSMDAGELLPRELTDILARLRADADHMPPGQLNTVLGQAWGRDWRRQFAEFGQRPIAAASIGQVHRARTRDGRDLAIKIQYPGVARSIDSDVDNVTALLRVSGLVPKQIDVAPLLAEAKRQLHDEADYAREGAYLARFKTLLADRPEFVVPDSHADLTRPTILAMDFVTGVPVESLVDAPQAERDRVVTLLLELVLRELFEFGLMQTDPNFANYLYDPATKRIALLDFGAAREIAPETAAGYARLLNAALDGDLDRAREVAAAAGFINVDAPRWRQEKVIAMLDRGLAPLRGDAMFDFGARDMLAEMRAEGVELAADRSQWFLPPVDTLFIQRKIGGMYLLATRLRARVNVRTLFERYLPADVQLPTPASAVA